MTELSAKRTYTDAEVLEILKEFKERWEGAGLPQLVLAPRENHINLVVPDKGRPEALEYIQFVKYMHFNDKWALFWSSAMGVTISTKLGLKLYFDNISKAA